MPGTILSVEVKVGDEIDAGQVVCVLEAMKMKNPIRASFDGTVTDIAVTAGQTVAYNDVAGPAGLSAFRDRRHHADRMGQPAVHLRRVAGVHLGQRADDGGRRAADLPGHRQGIRAGPADPHRHGRDPGEHSRRGHGPRPARDHGRAARRAVSSTRSTRPASRPSFFRCCCSSASAR